MLQSRLEAYQKQGLVRTLRIYDPNLINFSSNDYLGLAKAEKIKEGLIEAIKQYGFGSTSSPLICGYYSFTKELEEKFASLLGQEEAIFFNSGYHANIGLFSTFAENIIMDRLCHASIIDGSILSQKSFLRFRHGDLKNAENLLKKVPKSFLVTERIFSMEGDVSDVDNLAKIANKYESTFIVDDAHGFGILPFRIKADIVVVPLGKAAAGMGAIVASTKQRINFLRQFCRSYIYSTALPPAVIKTNLKVVELIEKETWRKDKLLELIEFFNIKANNLGINIASKDLTPIRIILMEDNFKAKKLEENLIAKGFLIKAIVRPTVPSARIRISLSALHTKEEISKLLDEISCQ